MQNRRTFLKSAALAGAGAAFFQTLGKSRAWAFAQSPDQHPEIRHHACRAWGRRAPTNIGQYIPLATKHTINFAGKATDVYNVAVTKFRQTMHPDLPGKTHFFGYTDLSTFDQKYLGGVIVAKRGTPVLLTTTNLVARPAHPAGGSHHDGRTQRADGRRSSGQPDRDPSPWRPHAVVQ